MNLIYKVGCKVNYRFNYSLVIYLFTILTIDSSINLIYKVSYKVNYRVNYKFN